MHILMQILLLDVMRSRLHHRAMTPLATTRQDRKSVAISARDLADLEKIKNAPEAVGLDESTSEAGVLAHALHVGLQMLREEREGVLYAQLAAEREADGSTARERSGLRARRRRHEVVE
jgi:hypothetical protein